MSLSHQKLQHRLNKLEANVPAMMHEHPDSSDFNEVFVAQADAITDSASTDDCVWAFEEVDRILERFDLWHPSEAQPRTNLSAQSTQETRRSSSHSDTKYSLQAWVEGRYARHCVDKLAACPYPGGTPMAQAWMQGWDEASEGPRRNS